MDYLHKAITNSCCGNKVHEEIIVNKNNNIRHTGAKASSAVEHAVNYGNWAGGAAIRANNVVR